MIIITIEGGQLTKDLRMSNQMMTVSLAPD